LLGCELTYHGSLPKPGETLVYEIDVDGHANQGDVRLFFFHYDCVLRDAQGHERPALSVRQGQAGFFTTKELADSAGILWKPEDQKVVPRDQARVDAPAIPSTRTAFSGDQIRAFSEGNAYACFGPGYERLLTHNRTPKIQAAPMLFLDEVTSFDPRAAPGSGATCAPRRPSRPTTGSSPGTSRTTRACRAPSCSRAASR
jgi:hypothetical protein